MRNFSSQLKGCSYEGKNFAGDPVAGARWWLGDGEEKKKPLTDDKLTQILQKKGYKIARRTVAKYREQLNIPVARLRKEI